MAELYGYGCRNAKVGFDFSLPSLEEWLGLV